TIGTLATIQCIVSCIANEHIGASIAHEAVGTLPASGAFNADQHILAVFKARGRTRQKIKKDGFVCQVIIRDIKTLAAHQAVISTAPIKAVIARATVQRICVRIASQKICIRIAEDSISAIAAIRAFNDHAAGDGYIVADAANGRKCFRGQIDDLIRAIT
ncbi:MAG: hypothetical protein LW837_01370, partial [Roseomonas sp.]|nr:hypothetical protein [Roseomonas sp.]